MRLREITMTVADLPAAAAFYGQALELPVTPTADQVRVQIGASVLTLIQSSPGKGSHHLAITIPSRQFASAKRWLAARVQPLRRDGADEFRLPPPWHSQSVYCLGPEGLLLELIARHDLADGTDPPVGDSFTSANLLCVSEVGIAVDDVDAAAGALQRDFGLARFDAGGPGFAPVGDPHGLLIVVYTRRVWFPTDDLVPSDGALVVTLETGTDTGSTSLQLGRCTLRPRRD